MDSLDLPDLVDHLGDCRNCGLHEPLDLLEVVKLVNFFDFLDLIDLLDLLDLLDLVDLSYLEKLINLKTVLYSNCHETQEQ